MAGGGDHDFKRGDEVAVQGGDELLGDDGLQDHGQLYPDLLLLVRRENVDDPVDRLSGTDRVQGGQDELPGLRRRNDGRMVSKSRISPRRMTSGA